MSGVATEPSVLIQAHIMHARLLVISPMDIFRYSPYCGDCNINPQIQVLICAESKEEAAVIRDENIERCSMQRRNGKRI